MKTVPTQYATPTCLLESIIPDYDKIDNLAAWVWDDDSYFVYNDLKEQVQDRIASSKSPSDLIRYTKLLLYVEHRAQREHDLCI